LESHETYFGGLEQQVAPTKKRLGAVLVEYDPRVDALLDAKRNSGEVALHQPSNDIGARSLCRSDEVATDRSGDLIKARAWRIAARLT
jgi:hypothetical protein